MPDRYQSNKNPASSETIRFESRQQIRRSDAVQEIISRRPGFMERWSLLVFLALLIIFFTAAWFISYPDYVQVNATLTSADLPDSRCYAQVLLPQENFGKIETGQRVLLRFDAYPYQEFGSVEGRLSHISTTISGGGFPASIELPGTMITNQNKIIRFRNGLTARAMIITRNSRLLQRFYYTVIRTGNQ